ncbi:glycosyltransferase [Gordonia sp. 'Campus']|uniref:glycosyltransferase n=1 Tax=Gordonia sp. 'Campus' TaxID=2915824 RepID=UPI001EE3B6A1|nr:glycosyltransferase [Gordonia sp. 'Campus']
MKHSSKPTVAIVGTRGYPSYYGGFETLIRKLVPFLTERGWRVVVYCRSGVDRLDDGAGGDSVVQVFSPGIEKKSLSTLSYGLTSSIDTAFRDVDVALVMNVANGYWLPILRARGVPVVLNVDGIEWERQKWGGLAKRVFRAGAVLSARYADRIVCDSLAIRDRWVSEFARVGAYIPYGGTEAGELEPVRGYRTGEYILYVARFVPENSVAEFVAAVERLPAGQQVVIVGSSGYGGEIEERVAALADACESVTWLGHISNDDELLALWQNCGAYFHGHSVGGTNPALVQAMACGAPTVARDTKFNREVLGDAGVFTEPDPEAIAEALISVMGNCDARIELGRSAMQRQREYFTWNGVCEAYESELLASMDSPRKTVHS